VLGRGLGALTVSTDRPAWDAVFVVVVVVVTVLVLAGSIATATGRSSPVAAPAMVLMEEGEPDLAISLLANSTTASPEELVTRRSPEESKASPPGEFRLLVVEETITLGTG
jgi:hypothetical protein